MASFNPRGQRGRPRRRVDWAALEAAPQISVMKWTAPLFVISILSIVLSFNSFYSCKMEAIDFTFIDNGSQPGWLIKDMLLFSILLFFFCMGLNFNYGLCPFCLQLATRHTKLKSVVYILQSPCWKLYYWLYFLLLLLPLDLLALYWLFLASRARHAMPRSTIEGEDNYCHSLFWTYSKILWMGFWPYCIAFVLRLAGINVGLILKKMLIFLLNIIKGIARAMFTACTGILNKAQLPEFRAEERMERGEANGETQQLSLEEAHGEGSTMAKKDGRTKAPKRKKIPKKKKNKKTSKKKTDKKKTDGKKRDADKKKKAHWKRGKNTGLDGVQKKSEVEMEEGVSSDLDQSLYSQIVDEVLTQDDSEEASSESEEDEESTSLGDVDLDSLDVDEESVESEETEEELQEDEEAEREETDFEQVEKGEEEVQQAYFQPEEYEEREMNEAEDEEVDGGENEGYDEEHNLLDDQEDHYYDNGDVNDDQAHEEYHDENDSHAHYDHDNGDDEEQYDDDNGAEDEEE